MVNYSNYYWNGKPIFYLTMLVSKVNRSPSNTSRIYSHMYSHDEKNIFVKNIFVNFSPPPPPDSGGSQRFKE